MEGNFSFRHFFGALDRFREKLICSNICRFEFGVDIFSLTMSQQRLLREVALLTEPGSPGISLKSLADELNLSSSAVSVMVEIMVQKKFLERQSSEVDRRQVLIRLSDAAWEAIEFFDAESCRILDIVDAGEMALLKKISEKIAEFENKENKISNQEDKK